MDDIQLQYLQLHDSLAKTNSPNDQPNFPNMDSLFSLLADSIPVDGKMSSLSEEQYENILRLVDLEINSAQI